MVRSNRIGATVAVISANHDDAVWLIHNRLISVVSGDVIPVISSRDLIRVEIRDTGEATPGRINGYGGIRVMIKGIKQAFVP